MTGETELQEALQWHLDLKIRKTLSAVNDHNMTGIFVRNKESALKEIFSRIPPKASVSHGGSRTLQELGIEEALRKGDYDYLLKNAPGGKGTRESRLNDFSCEIFLTSVNAITQKGELIAMDGFGNRAACLLFGPKKLIVVAGKNKLVGTMEDGIRRIREYVAPVHAKRRGWNVPCTKSGTCADCRDPMRICNKLAVLQYERDRDRTAVIIVGENLGI